METTNTPTPPEENLDILEEPTEQNVTTEPTQEEVTTDEIVMVPNAKQVADTFSPVKKFNTDAEIVTLPPDYLSKVDAAFKNVPNEKLDDDQNGREWASVLQQGLQQFTAGDAFNSTVSDKDALFVQEVESKAGKLMGKHPGFTNIDGPVQGEKAVIRFRSALGLGSVFRFPLYHSGFWVTLKAPSDTELLELNRIIINDKINLGRKTYGLFFSNSMVVTSERLVNLALANLYSSSLQVPAGDDIRNYISSTDIPTLIWGMACALFPQGFQYMRSCINKPSECKHVIKELLNVSKLAWTNSTSLTEWQLAHLASNSTTNKMTVESVQRYKGELLKAQNREVTLTSSNGLDLKFLLRVPTLNEYFESGHRWIGDIISVVNKALGIDAKDSDRSLFVHNNSQATAMRQYLHWVESITLGDAIVNDKESLEKTFDSLSADDKLREDFMQAIAKMVDDTTISVIGIPTFDCPNCGQENKAKKEFPQLTNIIPIDPYNTFFTLLMQRVVKITNRDL